MSRKLRSQIATMNPSTMYHTERPAYTHATVYVAMALWRRNHPPFGAQEIAEIRHQREPHRLSCMWCAEAHAINRCVCQETSASLGDRKAEKRFSDALRAAHFSTVTDAGEGTGTRWYRFGSGAGQERVVGSTRFYRTSSRKLSLKWTKVIEHEVTK